MVSLVESIANDELIEKLKQGGFAQLIQALEEPKAFTRGTGSHTANARVNKSALRRIMKLNDKELAILMEQAREYLEKITR